MGLKELQFLKLGGSLITDKTIPQKARLDVIARIADEIKDALSIHPEINLLVGHGSGSFGHVAAKKFGTRDGVTTPMEWRGFLQVWRDAGLLNRFVMDSLVEAGLQAINFPPSASIASQGREIFSWNLAPIRSALDAGLLPVVFGDVVFDSKLGGTIYSTEDLFDFLAGELRPRRILLAGLEPGVWHDYPACSRTIEMITPHNITQLIPSLGGSSGTDVTGGMYSKVLQSLSIVERNPDTEVVIFSGETRGNIAQILSGGSMGTCIRGDKK
jgi:isopentenyl phosphate kinase